MNQIERRNKQNKKYRAIKQNKFEVTKGKLFLSIIILGLFYFFFSLYFWDYVIKKNGVCINALLISETVRVRYHKDELKYEFKVNHKLYDGNSLETDLNQSGDSICVIYLENDPSKNRPLKYFKELTSVNCDCQ